jgi:catalase
MHMLTWLFSPRGIPANYRTQDGFGVNTYKMVNAAGEGVLVKYHWKSKQGVESLTQEQADAIQATELGSASKDAYEAIERGEYPEWELCVQIMSDDEHPELDFDPLDDTKTWPEDEFPLHPVGRMVLDQNVKDHHNENEQIAFGTGVLVDGLEFSDDKMLVGRTFSYSDTQRYRVGPNYLQLPVNAPAEGVPVNTNQRGGPMSYGVDGHGGNPHVNYEPSGHDGLVEADPNGEPYEPHIEGRLTRAPIERTNDYAQAGERYRTMPDAERDDLVLNLVSQLSQADDDVQERMLVQLSRCDEEYASRVAEGLERQVPADAGAATV